MRGLASALDDVPPGSGAVVMGTGIVSTALLLDRSLVLSRILLALTALVWGALAGVLVLRWSRNRDRFLAEARSPAGLTGVAGTAVLGTRIAELGWTAAGVVLLTVAFAGWAILMSMVLRRVRRERRGVVFMITVATEGVATISAALALALDRSWLLDSAVVMAVAGLLLYPLALRCFHLRELHRGSGDQWVAGGSLAISALALALIAEGAGRLGASGSLHTVIRDSALAVWAAAITWLMPLVLGEVRRPRLRYDTRRWATVFPLGMYAACSFAVADAGGGGGIRSFAAGWVWLAFAAWVLVFGGMLRAIARAAGDASRATGATSVTSAPRATPTRPTAARPRPAGSTTQRASCRRRAR